jgi:glycosyltransferase involved in cell wall biosynthesis
MRIVAHNGAQIWGGAERATVSLLRGLAERGHEVLLLCNTGLVASEASSRGVTSRICKIGGDVMLNHAWRIKRELEREKPDAFMVGTYKKLFIAAWGAKLARVPRVVARVGLESDTPRSFKYRFALRHWTDGVVVNARRMIKPFTGMNDACDGRVRLIWNSVMAPAELVRTTAVRREVGIDDDAFVVGAVARLSIQKRLDRLIHATAAIPGAHCVIAGEGTSRETLEQIIQELNVGDRVHLLGERTDVNDVLDALDVYAVTSNSEGMSNAMLEAMSRGLPLVSTDVSGAVDALGPDSSGNIAGLIVGFDVESLRSALERLRGDDELRASLATAARQRALTWFSREKMLSDWEEFLSAR